MNIRFNKAIEKGRDRKYQNLVSGNYFHLLSFSLFFITVYYLFFKYILYYFNFFNLIQLQLFHYSIIYDQHQTFFASSFCASLLNCFHSILNCHYWNVFNFMCHHQKWRFTSLLYFCFLLCLEHFYWINY